MCDTPKELSSALALKFGRIVLLLLAANTVIDTPDINCVGPNGEPKETFEIPEKDTDKDEEIKEKGEKK